MNHAHAAGVKAILGISEDNSLKAIKACTTPARITQFVTLMSDFVEEHHYDGVDVEWGNGIASALYEVQYQNLIRSLRAAMPTATISVPIRITDSYVAPVAEELDQINLMAYDLDIYSLRKARTNHRQHGSTQPRGDKTSDNALDPATWPSLARMGIAPAKIGLGVPFYGRIEQGCLDSTGTTGVTDPDQTAVNGISSHLISYRDLAKSLYWSSGDHVWDELQQSQYIRYSEGSCRTDAFIPYGGVEQMQAAVSQMKANGLGGIMTYGLSYEYISTQDGDARYPLSTAFYHAISDTPAKPATIEAAHQSDMPLLIALAARSRLGSTSAVESSTDGTFTYYVDSAHGCILNPGTFAKPLEDHSQGQFDKVDARAIGRI